MTEPHASTSFHAYEDTLTQVQRLGGQLLVIRVGQDANLSLYVPASKARNVRDQLSRVLGDDGSSRLAGTYQGQFVVVDDHGEHLYPDALVELPSCPECVDRPATTTNAAGAPRCLAHA